MELVIKLRLFKKKKKRKLLKEETVNNYNDHTPDETIMYNDVRIRSVYLNQ